MQLNQTLAYNMMNRNLHTFIFFLIVLCFCINSCATSNIPENHTIIDSNRGTISVSELTVENDNITPGLLAEGMDALNIEYPDMCWNARIDGTVTLFIDIDENGEPTDVKVNRGIGGGCDEAAWRVFRNVKYNPARMSDGSATSYRHWVSVTYSLR